MALIVGNLLADPAAQSFISREDADAYLGIEQNEAWNLAGSDKQEAALVLASRWLRDSYEFRPLSDDGLARLGRVAARLAIEFLASGKTSLFEGIDTSSVLSGFRAGPYSETYAVGLKSDAAGMAWPWLDTMLNGLVRKRGLGIGVMVI